MAHDFYDSLAEEDNPIHGLGTLLAHMAGSHTDQVHSFFLSHDIVAQKKVLKISSSLWSHMGVVSFSHDYCSDSHCPYYVQSGTCYGKAEEPPCETWPAGQNGHKRTDLVGQHEGAS